MLYSFQPFSTDKKRFGETYNAHCGMVPNEDDWILILDYDCMILDSRAYKIMQKAIETHPEVEIFTAFASRIGYSDQRIDPSKIDPNDSILYHKKIAEDLASQWPNGECNHTHSAAGFFLLFKKSYWMKNPFQPEIMDSSGRYFDWNFCMSAMRKNAIRVIRGIYCWHTYRLGQENIREGSHLR